MRTKKNVAEVLIVLLITVGIASFSACRQKMAEVKENVSTSGVDGRIEKGMGFHLATSRASEYQCVVPAESVADSSGDTNQSDSSESVTQLRLDGDSGKRSIGERYVLVVSDDVPPKVKSSFGLDQVASQVADAAGANFVSMQFTESISEITSAIDGGIEGKTVNNLFGASVTTSVTSSWGKTKEKASSFRYLVLHGFRTITQSTDESILDPVLSPRVVQNIFGNQFPPKDEAGQIQAYQDLNETVANITCTI